VKEVIMSQKKTERTSDEPKTEDPAFTDICRDMMTGELPDCCARGAEETTSSETPPCCGPEMKGMMTRMMGAFESQAGQTRSEKGVRGK
jgi:hypothetical protein